MPYREKVAWLSLVAMVVTFGPYFVLSALHAPPAGAGPDVDLLIRFTITAAAQVLIIAIGHVLLRRRSPEDAREPADERDRAIERRSMQLAYYVLIGGVVVVGVVMPFKDGGWAIVNAALLAIIVAELVHYGVAAWSYRRGAA